MPTANEPAARLLDVTVAEVAEALEAPARLHLRQRIGKDMLAVYSVTADQRAIAVLLARGDDSFVWRVASAKQQNAEEFETWLGRTGHE
jgi:CO/xanthine dehydrogenase Mo-binding subunit